MNGFALDEHGVEDGWGVYPCDMLLRCVVTGSACLLFLLAGCGDANGPSGTAGSGASAEPGAGGMGAGGSGAGAGAAGAGGSGLTCPSSAVCAALETGWIGPQAVVRHAPDVAAGCNVGAGAESELLGLTELTDIGFDCTCANCTISGTCAGAAIDTFVNGGCTQPTQPIPLTTGICATPVFSPLRLQVNPPEPTNGACAADPIQTPGPPTAYASALSACDPGVPSACDSGVCIEPADGGEGICIARAGDHPCPAPYEQKHLVHEGLLDERSCACDCELADATCEGSVTGYAGGQCTGNQEVLPASCYQGPAHSSFLSNFALSGACTATASTAGRLIELEPTTVCCMPNQ